MADLFDAALSLEDVHIKEGFDEGVKSGQLEGYIEGRSLGVIKGFEIVSEVGFYRGCVVGWHHILGQLPQTLSSKAARTIKSMEAVLDTFPLNDAKDEQLQEALEDLRARYKAVCAMLNLQPSVEQKSAPLNFMDF
eukprot:jgi/Botrbrau1/19949/Bobra.0059s0066.1